VSLTDRPVGVGAIVQIAVDLVSFSLLHKLLLDAAPPLGLGALHSLSELTAIVVDSTAANSRLCDRCSCVTYRYV